MPARLSDLISPLLVQPGFSTRAASSQDREQQNQELGFVDNKGVFTTISYPGETFTEATGINDDGVIAGYFANSGNSYEGFLATP